jgi:hypothetical protein
MNNFCLRVEERYAALLSKRPMAYTDLRLRGTLVRRTLKSFRLANLLLPRH